MESARLVLVSLAVAALSLAGCGGDGPAAGSGSDPNLVRVTLNSDDQMRFDKKLIEVPAGARVELTLKHVGELPVDVMGHNFVLLESGTDLDAFALSAARAKDTDYIPTREMDRVIAYTKMLGGGQTDTITFTAPAPGRYKFICSFPAHYMKMQGDFVVR